MGEQKVNNLCKLKKKPEMQMAFVEFIQKIFFRELCNVSSLPNNKTAPVDRGGFIIKNILAFINGQ